MWLEVHPPMHLGTDIGATTVVGEAGSRCEFQLDLCSP